MRHGPALRPSKGAPARLYVAALLRDLSMPHLRVFAATFAAVFASSALLAGASAQDRRLPSSPAELQLSFAPVVKRAAPAVVNVYATRVVENRNPFMNDPMFRQFFGAVPREQVLRSLGSGVIVDPSGLVVTN